MEIQKRKLSGRLLQPVPELQPGRKLSAKVKIKSVPVPELETTETICFDGLCTVKERPAKIELADLSGMDYKELVSLFQRQAAYHEIHIPNDWRGLVLNFSGHMKSRYSGERMSDFGDLSNMTVITNALKKFIK